jgi:hypothetical protein
MVGNYIEGKGWEILCDNLGLFVGYVEGSHTPNARTMKPNDEDYVIFCQELYYIDKIGDYVVLNGNSMNPTNTIIDYAEKMSDRVCIELDNTIYDCYLSNTYINGEFAQTLDDLYDEYLFIIGQ